MAGRGLEETATSETIESPQKILSPAHCLVPDSDGTKSREAGRQAESLGAHSYSSAVCVRPGRPLLIWGGDYHRFAESRI